MELIGFITGFVTFLHLRCLAQRVCWWTTQWSSIALPVANAPWCYFAIAGALSAIDPAILFNGGSMSLTAKQTELNKSVTLFDP